MAVKVQADNNGGIIRVSHGNPEYGYIRVTEENVQINNQGWMRYATRSALIKGKMVDLQRAKYTAGQEINGKIVIRESLTPFNPENADKDLKLAGQTGIVCRVNDQPIYRQTFFTQNLDQQDEFISHTNSDEIRDVQKAQHELSKIVQ